MSKYMVNTVLGKISPNDMGITLVHEHLLFGYPGWYGDLSYAPFDRKKAVAAGVNLLKQLKEYGLKTIIDATTNDCGRDADVLKEISEKAQVNIICTTGYYYEGEGAPVYWKVRKAFGADVVHEIYDLLMKEITEGIMGTGIKAGVIKVAMGKNSLSDYDRWHHTAAARAQKDGGIPIISHTQEGTMGPEQAEFLVSEGADPKRLTIGHMCDNLDIEYQIRTLKSAGFVSWDRMGLQSIVGCPSDVDRYNVLVEMIKKGYGNRLLMSHDSVNYWLARPLNIPEAAKAFVTNWHPTHLFKNIIKYFKENGVQDAQIKMIIQDNPRRLFAGE